MPSQVQHSKLTECLTALLIKPLGCQPKKFGEAVLLFFSLLNRVMCSRVVVVVFFLESNLKCLYYHKMSRALVLADVVCVCE